MDGNLVLYGAVSALMPVAPSRATVAGDGHGGSERLMAGGSSRVIARIFSTHNSEYASLTWEWILRADGQVYYRLAQLRGRREHNLWRPVAQVSGAHLHAFIHGTASAEQWLAGLAIDRGHHVGGLPRPRRRRS